MGCEDYVRQEAQNKLEARSEKCLFIGYPEESFGYLFYKPSDNVVFVAQRGVFLEREMISKEDNESKIDLEEIQESVDEEPIVNTNTQPEVVTRVVSDDRSLPISKTSGRVSKPPQFYYGFHIEEDKISDSTLSELDEPANYKETVGFKWIFKKKTYIDGKVHTFKARLVANGYTQTHEIDYEETSSPVAKIKSIRIMLAIAVFHDYEIWQMDITTAFINGKLIEDVFMAQPEGFENANGSVVVFLVLYVDDILLIGNDIPTLQSVKDWLGKCFAMKDLEDAAYILGIKIYKDRTGQNKSSPICFDTLLTNEPTTDQLPSKFNEFTRQTKELKKHVHELEIKLSVSSVQAKIKTLDALPSMLLKVIDVLNKFAQVIEFASHKTKDPGVPLAVPASTHPAEGKKNTQHKDKRKEAMSSKDVKEEKNESDSDDDTINLTGSMAESSKKKKLKRFVFITEQGDHVHLTEEQIKEQKRIAESVKGDVAKQEVEVRKEEWIDFLGVDVVKKYYQAKLQYC
ncbi:RNA-directed DNA polymerase, eukaryota [Tanacetum coccineum]